MKARIIDEAALTDVSPLSLATYAKSDGWTEVEPFGEHSRVYAKDGAEAIIPGTSSLGDYSNVVAALLETFSRTSGRDELQIYRDLVTLDRDVVRVRLPDAERDGSVRVDAGVELVTGAHELFLSAACSAWEARPVYRAGRVKRANEYMAGVRLGQTEQGSFVVTLLAPVPPAIETQRMLWPEESNEPYERLVTRRLASGLDAAAEAIERFTFERDFSVFEDAVGKGLSANLCDAAASLCSQDGGIEISITWAQTRPTPQPRWHRKLTRAEGETLREVARLFHEKQPRPDEQLEGVVVKLQSEDPSVGGDIALLAMLDGKGTTIAAALAPREYALAIEAHRANRAISIIGTLERHGRRWRYTKVTALRVLESEDNDDPF